jgi:hypothetical protein
MTDLTELLDRASVLEATPMPITDDLARAHAALHRQRRRRGLVTVGSLAVVGVLAGVAGPPLLDRGPEGGGTTTVTEPRSNVQLVAANVSSGPYTFGKLPTGWEVQGQFPQGVTIAIVGDDDQEPLSFRGKLVIMYDQNAPSGDRTEVNGREFFSNTDSDHDTVAVRTRAGEPDGVVSVQYPDSAGWSVETMIEFLDAVLVGQAAQPGVG